MSRTLRLIAGPMVAMTLFVVGPCMAAAPESFESLGNRYTKENRPVLARFCLDCHSTAKMEGDLDLERFATLAEVRKEPRIWLKVIEMLDNGEMPPKEAKQPSADERKQLRGWARQYLDAEAFANAGDPGRVVLRRLSNVEYDLTVRDLTGVDLKAAKEFPGDGAAGEGFTNVGEALVMSPALLQKYLDAAKDVADHAVLLPDGFRFSPSVSRRDWTNEYVDKIRGLYTVYADAEGRIPLDRYLAATIEVRDSRTSGKPTLGEIAAKHALSEKYLRTLSEALTASSPSLLLDPIRARWRTAKAADAPALAAAVRERQQGLWRFNTVAHFKQWQEPVSVLPASVRLEQRFENPTSDVVVYLAAHDAGDGRDGDAVVWRQPRLETPGKPPVYLRDLRAVMQALAEFVPTTLAASDKYLAAVAQIHQAALRREARPPSLAEVAAKNGLNADVLAQWLNTMGVAANDAIQVQGHLAAKQNKVGGYDFVNGWATNELPSLVANSSAQSVNIPGVLPPHSVVVHPSPELFVAAAWQSPIDGFVDVQPLVADAHNACGNGVGWSLELRRGGWRQLLGSGIIDNGGKANIAPTKKLEVHRGDLLTLKVSPRGKDHGCDLTLIDLSIREMKTVEPAGKTREWSLSKDVSPDVQASNPHADLIGNPKVWHFIQGKDDGDVKGTELPAGSLLAEWRAALAEPSKHDRLAELAKRIGQQLKTTPAPADGSPNAKAQRWLASLDGPLFGGLDYSKVLTLKPTSRSSSVFGLDAGVFGPRPDAQGIGERDLLVHAPSTLELRLPAGLAKGRSLVVEGELDPRLGLEGSVQLELKTTPTKATGDPIVNLPVVTAAGSRARERLANAQTQFRQLFPAFVCYRRIVPVDEVVTLVEFHRDDEGYARLMLDEASAKQLDRWWTELRYVSQDALKIQEAYTQFMEYVTQDGDVRIFEPLRKPIRERAEAFRKLLVDTEPVHMQKLLAFASRAFRRPMTDQELSELQTLYAKLRKAELSHDAAFRLTMARMLVAPSFLYRIEHPAAGLRAQLVSNWEMASRLSYFFWSSLPDEELRRAATAGELRDPDKIAAQAKRMLRDARVRPLATEFACQWLDIRNFDQLDEKNEKLYPEFAGLRGDMYEETVRFFVDLFQRDGSLLEILDADHAILNAPLAKFYGVAGVDGPAWRRVEGVKKQGRGGVLGMATVLAKHSGASRTSPVLRGNWVSEFLLGEKLPKPPKNVPQLPQAEGDSELTVRQLVEKHREVAACAKCHNRIDPFGFALEGFDTIGRARSKDLAGRPIDVKATLADGTSFEGVSGLRSYLLNQRRDQFVRYFCRKLLGYALGRGVHLADEPLLDEMGASLRSNEYHFGAAVDVVVRSPQFRQQRGLESTKEE